MELELQLVNFLMLYIALELNNFKMSPIVAAYVIVFVCNCLTIN